MSHAHHDHDHHDHDHHHHGLFSGHDHSRDLRGASNRSLTTAFVLITSYMFAEAIGGIMRRVFPRF